MIHGDIKWTDIKLEEMKAKFFGANSGKKFKMWSSLCLENPRLTSSTNDVYTISTFSKKPPNVCLTAEKLH